MKIAKFYREVCLMFLAIFLAGKICLGQSVSGLQPIVNRDYRLDLYESVIFGSPRLVSMGGAAFAVGEGASGLFTNPAAAAIRSSAQTDQTAFTAFLNSYIPIKGIDFNNNGVITDEFRKSAVYAPGALVQFGQWGLAANFGYTSYEVAPQAGGGLGVRTLIPHVAGGQRLFENTLTVGLGLRGALLNVYTKEASQGLFTFSGVSAELGSVWQPRAPNFRLSVAVALPVYADAVHSDCDPNNCFGYILPNQVVSPWVMVVGTGWKFSRSRWNEPATTQYRDEFQVTLAFDLLVTGALSNAFGIEEFAAKKLHASGKRVSWSPRFGCETEVIPGWIRLRGGTYWEPARYEDITGRLHGTVGCEFRVFKFSLKKTEYRIALACAADFARRYQNVGISIGLWN